MKQTNKRDIYLKLGSTLYLSIFPNIIDTQIYLSLDTGKKDDDKIRMCSLILKYFW